jgi:hypothetical protein
MDKLDRLGWAAGISFTAYGLRVGIRVNRLQLWRRLEIILPPGARPEPGKAVDLLYSFLAADAPRRPGLRPFHLLYRGASRLAREPEIETVWTRLKEDLPLRIAEFAPRHVFVHAGVVGWKGRAILVPGRSYTGKTTLVAELIKAGAAYYSDEYAVLDPSGYVHPFPKPLSIRGANPMAATEPTAEELGAKSASRPLPVGLVLVTEYRKGASWDPCPQSPGLGVLALLANCVAARRQPRRVLSVLRKAVARAEVLKGLRGEAREVVDTVLRRSPVTCPWLSILQLLHPRLPVRL